MAATEFVRADDPAAPARLARDGVVLVDGLLTGDEVAETRERLRRYERDVLPRVPRVYYDYYGNGVLRNMTDMQRYDPWFEEFAHRERFWTLFRGVVDWEPQLYYLETFPRWPGCKPLRMHQELHAGPVEPPQFLHLWIALDDVTNDNSGMVFYRGSHRLGPAPHIIHPDGLPEIEPELLERMRDRRMEPDIPAGSAALFDCATIHGSKANITDTPRLSLIVAVRGVGTKVNGDLEIFATVIARFFREELGLDGCSAEDDFVALGEDVAATRRVLKRIADFYGVELTPEQFAAHRSPRALAAELIRRTGRSDRNA